MSAKTGIRAFETTLQTTNIWLNKLEELLGWDDRQRAYHALTAVLHALRDRLPLEQVVALGAQLPMLIRGIYYEGWRPGDKPLKERKKEIFLRHVAAAFRDDADVNAEAIARAVFQVIAEHVSPGEVKHIKITLPEEIRSLWSRETQTMWF